MMLNKRKFKSIGIVLSFFFQFSCSDFESNKATLDQVRNHFSISNNLVSKEVVDLALKEDSNSCKLNINIIFPTTEKSNYEIIPAIEPNSINKLFYTLEPSLDCDIEQKIENSKLYIQYNESKYNLFSLNAEEKFTLEQSINGCQFSGLTKQHVLSVKTDKNQKYSKTLNIHFDNQGVCRNLYRAVRELKRDIRATN